MSTTNHLRAAGHHAKMAGQWKRVEAEQKLTRRAFDEHATAVAYGRMGAPAAAHAHEARAHFVGAVAEAVGPAMPMPPPPLVAPHRYPSPPPRVVEVFEEGSPVHTPVHVLPARVVVDDLTSPTIPPMAVTERALPPPVLVDAPPHLMPTGPPPGAVPVFPRRRTRDALRNVVNSAVHEGRRKLGEGGHYMARKADVEHHMAMNSSAMGLPAKAHKHEGRAHMAGAVAGVLGKHGIPPQGRPPIPILTGEPPVVVGEDPHACAPALPALMGCPL